MTIKVPRQWLCMGKTQILNNMFEPIQNRPDGVLKPYGGLWVSPYVRNGKYKSHWHEWCEQNEFKTCTEGTIIKLQDNLNVYIINSQIDLMKLIEEVGEYNPFPDIGFDFMWKTVDFEEAAKKYDLIYLTRQGLNCTRLPFRNHKFNLYTWDVSCAILFDFKCIKGQSPTKVRVLGELD